jgi:2-(1,2-epoxy-1,2-dihydrophenyl)acetyl-CoA isomerase
MTDYETLRVEHSESVAHITLDSPSRFNSLTIEMADELLTVITDLNEDESVRCLTLTGNDEAFCSGADLAALDGDESDAPRLRRLASRLHDSVIQLHQAETPLVTGIDGVAAGAGVGMALAGDLVVMSEDSVIEFAYPRIGLTGDGGATFLLPRLVGLRRAKEIALLDEPIGADYAVSLGLVTESVPASEFDSRLHDLAQQLADGPTAALSATKRLLTESFDRDLAQQLAEETDTIAKAARTEDYQRGHEAFFGDEEPEFVGR